MKRKTRTFRVRASLDARLIAAAHANERSVSEEIEHRLELAFAIRPVVHPPLPPDTEEQLIA